MTTRDDYIDRTLATLNQAGTVETAYAAVQYTAEALANYLTDTEQPDPVSVRALTGAYEIYRRDWRQLRDQWEQMIKADKS